LSLQRDIAELPIMTFVPSDLAILLAFSGCIPYARKRKALSASRWQSFSLSDRGLRARTRALSQSGGYCFFRGNPGDSPALTRRSASRKCHHFHTYAKIGR
jgi:hypothetical protein